MQYNRWHSLHAPWTLPRSFVSRVQKVLHESCVTKKGNCTLLCENTKRFLSPIDTTVQNTIRIVEKGKRNNVQLQKTKNSSRNCLLSCALPRRLLSTYNVFHTMTHATVLNHLLVTRPVHLRSNSKQRYQYYQSVHQSIHLTGPETGVAWTADDVQTEFGTDGQFASSGSSCYI